MSRRVAFWDLVARITDAQEALRRPAVVGISGYGGSGKSTLARRLAAELPDAVRIRGDDFLDPERSHRRSSDWDGVERERLRDQVLRPFREGRAGAFQRFDWSTRALGAPEALPHARVMVVDLIGLFHPDLLPWLDVTIWCEVDLLAAVRRGVQRDAESGHDHARLWEEVWVPNERDFDARFEPRDQAHLLYDVHALPRI